MKNYYNEIVVNLKQSAMQNTLNFLHKMFRNDAKAFHDVQMSNDRNAFQPARDKLAFTVKMVAYSMCYDTIPEDAQTLFAYSEEISQLV